jgi:hypothetical protein
MAGGTTRSATYFVIVVGSRVGPEFAGGGGKRSGAAVGFDEHEIAKGSNAIIPTPAAMAPNPAPARPIDFRKSRRVTPWLSLDTLNLLILLI